MKTIEEALNFIHSCNKFGGKKDDLRRMNALMEALGNPERLYPSIHIAGTNGKGSTAAITDSILRAAGYRTGLFTSPFLVRFNERMRINGEEIPDDRLIGLTERVREACEKIQAQGFAHPLEFEVVTAIGFLYFAEEKVNIAVIEVGLGGLLDSTNILSPVLCAITPIAYDHTAILGDTIEEIAAQKAGIIKEGVPVVVAEQTYPEAFVVIEETAKKKHAPLIAAPSTAGVCEKYGLRLFDGTLLALPGEHQKINLGCALSTVRAFDPSVSEEAVRQGIASTRWDGRCQWIGDDLLIDGAHNPAGMETLCAYLAEFVPEPVTLLFCAMGDKDAENVIGQIAPFAKEIITTNAMPGRGLPAERLAELFRCVTDVPVVPAEDPEQAFALARSRGGITLVCGSLYLAGAVLNLLRAEFVS